MSPEAMLSSSTAASQNVLPKLLSDGSNWILWKARIRIYIGSKKLAHLLDETTVRPTKPEPLGNNPTDDAHVTYDTVLEKYQEFTHSDLEVQNIIVLTIPNTLFINSSPAVLL